MNDVVDAIQAFICYLYGPACYVIAPFQIVNDISEYGFFAFIAGKNLHSDRYLVCIKEQSHTNKRFFFIFLGLAFHSKIIFLVNLEIEVAAVKVGVWSIKTVSLIDLVVVDLNDFLVLRTDIFKAVIKLTQRKVMFLKEFWNDLDISFRLWTGMDSPCVNEVGHHFKDIKTEICCGLHKVNVFFTTQRIVDIP